MAWQMERLLLEACSCRLAWPSQQPCHRPLSGDRVRLVGGTRAWRRISLYRQLIRDSGDAGHVEYRQRSQYALHITEIRQHALPYRFRRMHLLGLGRSGKSRHQTKSQNNGHRNKFFHLTLRLSVLFVRYRITIRDKSANRRIPSVQRPGNRLRSQCVYARRLWSVYRSLLIRFSRFVEHRMIGPASYIPAIASSAFQSTNPLPSGLSGWTQTWFAPASKWA